MRLYFFVLSGGGRCVIIKPMKQKLVFKGKLLKLFSGPIDLPNGRTGYFEEVRHPGAALVVPFLGEDAIVCIRQYRAVIGKYLWELPAGTLNRGETPLECARREVTEETGYKVTQLRRIGFLYTTPGFCNEIIHVYRADCAERVPHDRDADEVISVRVMKKRAVQSLVKKGRINDSKTIAALALANVL